MVIRSVLRRSLMIAGSAALLGGGLACNDPSSPTMTAGTQRTFLQIKTLSNRADLISGGDALVEIGLPSDATADPVHVTVTAVGANAAETDVSGAFVTRSSGRIIGLLTGLAEGDNLVKADQAGQHTVALTITNHKLSGSIFSGPQVKPFVCATPTGSPATADKAATEVSGLSGEPNLDDCRIATEAKLFYRSTVACTNVRPDPVPPPRQGDPPPIPCFKPYDPATPPADLAMTTTDTGVTMPYIVRVERGTLNRGIYDIAVLFDPKADDVATGWKPYAPQPGWNGKVVYSFGASSGQPRRQFRSEQNWNDDSALSRGFLVADNSMTDSFYNSNRVLMTETLVMMKEKIGDSFGEIRYTIGNGCSGGSINQLTATSIFPGLLDGIQPTCTYSDSETTGIEVTDCALLVNFYNSQAWTDLMKDVPTVAEKNAKKAAINGHRDQVGCHRWFNSFFYAGKPGKFTYLPVDPVTGVLAPTGTEMNNCQLPAGQVYDPAQPELENRVRCSPADNAVAIYGTVKETVKDKDGNDVEVDAKPVRARTTADNVGVQYGLKALVDGKITAEEFVVLNEKIGGVNFDDDFVPVRTEADEDALNIAYRSGLVTDAHNLANTAIIDIRGYDEEGIHYNWRSVALRARLDAANGGHDNQLWWRFGPAKFTVPGVGDTNLTMDALNLDSFLLMDKWLDAAKKAGGSIADAKPKDPKDAEPDAVDFCYLGTDFTKRVTDAAMCDADMYLKPNASPRQVAGGPVTEDVLKCQLKDLDPADYAPAVLTQGQIDRLKAVFKKGVCDFTKPGIGQQVAKSPLTFAAGAGGVPLGTAPGNKAQ